MLALQIFLIAVNAYFAGTELALVSVSEIRLRALADEGDKRAKQLLKLTGKPEKFLSTIQIAITLSGFLGSALAADSFAEPLTKWIYDISGMTYPETGEVALESVMVIVITLILSFFTLVFGELVPKRVAQRKGEAMALKRVGFITSLSKLFTPFVWLLSAATNAVLRMRGIDPHEEVEQVDEEDIRLMVDAGSESGTIDHEEKELIRNVFEFDDLNAGDIATHRTEVALLWMEDDISVWEETIHENRHTLYPVCEESADHVVGILNAKDFFRLADKNREAVLENTIKQPYFVPENVKADVLFRNMKNTRNNMAIVLDEYGGMTGIVTLYDLVEQLVGEFDSSDAPVGEGEDAEGAVGVEEISENTYALHGNVELNELGEVTGLTFEQEDCDTFTGLVFSELGYIPDDGEQDIDIVIGRMTIRITEVQDHMVKEATVEVAPAEDDEDEDEDRDESKEKED
ncbi:MAG: HlyC/CorC family transporter [Clostridia bacterium]|nr:HlyC/CorC family transporter [Clostridia bacterium]